MKRSDIPTPASARAAANESLEDDAAATDEPEDLAAGEARTSGASGDPEAELVAVRDKWLRTEAELQNFRRRTQRDLEEARRSAEERALLDLIDFLDDLERALAAARDAGAEASWVQGVELVAQRMRDSLARAGVTAVTPVGEPFDPRFHEALVLMPAPAGKQPGTVLHVERTGYRRGDRVLRPARVTVAAESPGDA